MEKIISDRMVKRIQEKINEKGFKVFNTDIVRYCLCRLNDDFKPMQSTNIYKLHSVEYCKMIEVISDYLD